MLRSPALAVEHDDQALTDLERLMIDTMIAHRGVGLAAPQVSVLRRVLCFRSSELSERTVTLINPKLEWQSVESELDLEGCLSLPGVLVPVPRSLRIRVREQRPGGRPRTLELEGYEARIVQHELDHLDGVLILERTDRESKRSALRALAGHLS